MHILIVGAGIGGLTLGIALRKEGHEVTIFERRPDFADHGAGIVLAPNVLAAVAELGLGDALLDLGRPIAAMNVTSETGRLLSTLDYSFLDLPYPAVALHRAELHALLLEHFDGRLEKGVAPRLLGDATKPRVALGERKFEGDLLVGADGIRSEVRSLVDPDFRHRYSGVTCYRFVASNVEVDTVMEMWGRGKRLGVVPLTDRRAYVFLTENAPARSQLPFASPEELRGRYREFGGPAPELLSRLESLETLLHNDLEDGLASRFAHGRVVLLGDAAHPVTPNLGQGAGLAIEDAVCLAHQLRSSSSLAVALENYEKFRRPRARFLRDRSYSLGRIGQLDSPVLCGLRDFLLRVTPTSANRRALTRIVKNVPGLPEPEGRISVNLRNSTHLPQTLRPPLP